MGGPCWVQGSGEPGQSLVKQRTGLGTHSGRGMTWCLAAGPQGQGVRVWRKGWGSFIHFHWRTFSAVSLLWEMDFKHFGFEISFGDMYGRLQKWTTGLLPFNRTPRHPSHSLFPTSPFFKAFEFRVLPGREGGPQNREPHSQRPVVRPVRSVSPR